MSFKFKYILVLLVFPITLFNLVAEEKVYQDEYIVESDSQRPRALSNDNSVQILSRGSFATHLRLTRSSTARALTAKHSKIATLERGLVEADCKQIKKALNAKFCEPNFVKKLYDTTPNDPDYFDGGGYGQFYHNDPLANGTTAFDLKSEKAWDLSTGSSSIVVAVLDSGINYDHPDLIDNLWNNPGEVPGNNIDDDLNGYTDDVHGINAYTSSGDPMDCNGHGTHVSGIIGAKGNNAKGVVGICWNVQLMAVRIAPDCGGNLSTAAEVKGLEYIYDLKVNRGVNILVVNASFGGPSNSDLELAAIAQLAKADIIFVAAAGNEGVNTDLDPRYPASYNLDNIISVANLNTANVPNSLNSSSNFGVITVDIAAPGTAIYSTINSDNNLPEQYGFKTGTSMSAPMVSGALALLKAQRPQYNEYPLLISTLLENSFPLALLQNKVKSQKMLNLFTLLSAPQAVDACPNDPTKVLPGTCGCGVVDNYINRDNDAKADCVDGCPIDANKIAPGVCGCGVPDIDSDRDGVFDCQDACPGDPAKSQAGFCGCGIPDADNTANGVADCIDANLVNEVPVQPIVKIVKNKILIQLSPRAAGGVQQIVRVVYKIPGKKKNTEKMITTSGLSLSIKAPAVGTQVSVSYFYQMPGYNSATSPAKSLKIRGR